MPLVITSNPPAVEDKFSITANPPQMPDITVTAAMQGSRLPDNAVFEWSATLEFKSSHAPNGGTHNTRHPDIAPQTGPNPSWRIPFTKVSGGELIVQVVMRAGSRSERESKKWKIVGSNPTSAAIRIFFNGIAANGTEAKRTAFRKLMRHESDLRQFLSSNYWPLYSEDGKGGVGLCQLTDPAPTDEQTWDWQENVRAGWALYQVKEREARGYPGREQRRTRFRQLVDAWNRHTRPGLQPLPVVLPAFTDDKLMRDTLRRFNGGHEYQPRQVNGILVVTVNANGESGTAEWESIPVAQRTGPGDHNYVENVLAEADY